MSEQTSNTGGGTPAATPPAVNIVVQSASSSSNMAASVAAAPLAPSALAIPVSMAASPQVTMVTSLPAHGAATNPTQVNVTPAITQMMVSHAQSGTVHTVSAPTAGAVIRSALPQTVQVIQGIPFLQQQQHQYLQHQQCYIQSVQGNRYVQSVQGNRYVQSVQAMQAQPMAQQVSLAPVQGRPPSASHNTVAGQKSPIVTIAGSQAAVTLKSVSPMLTSATGAIQTKAGGKMIQQQQTAVFNTKQVLRGSGQPMVIGQLGVLSNPGNQQTLVAQPKSPSVSIAPGTQQIINSPQTHIPVRLTQPAFVTSQGQILGNVSQAMLNQFQMATIQPSPMPMTQQVIGSQNALIGTQPLYLRPAGTLQTQQGIVQAVIPNASLRHSTDSSGTVQMKSTGTQVKTVAPQQVKGVTNILPQTARPVGQVPGSPTIARAVQTAQNRPMQISKVRALRPQMKATQVITSQQAKIAPQIGMARLLTPTMGRTPTLLVPPKPQLTQRPVISTAVVTASPNTATPSSSQMVTIAAVTSLPVAMVANTQTEVTPLQQTRVSPEMTIITTTATAAVSPQKPTATTAVSPLKIEAPPCDGKSKKSDESRESEQVSLPGGVIGAGAGPDRPSGDSEAPPSLPPMQHRGGDRSDRIATVIGERQAAIVKPNILTHVIEGFVIQEAPEPFPVQRCSALSDFIPGNLSGQDNDSNMENDSCLEKDTDESSVSSAESKNQDKTESGSTLKLKCEFCNKMAPLRNFRRSKRFCSRACAKRFNVGCSQRMGLFKTHRKKTLTAVARKKVIHLNRRWKRGQGGRVSTGPIQRTPEFMFQGPGSVPLPEALDIDDDDGHDLMVMSQSGLGAPSTISMDTTTTTSSDTERSTTPSGQDESSSPRSPPELEREIDIEHINPGCIPQRPLNKWSVQEVVDFVRNLPGCGMYADEFNRQEIDGQALMLLKEDHLMTAMSIKLGPALKICSKINSLKDDGTGH